MPNFLRTISYEPYTAEKALSRRLFLLGLILCASLAAFYVYFVYVTVEQSYKIDAELQLLKKDYVSYQQAEEQYISKLDGMQEEGKRVLGLNVPGRQSFIDRHAAVAKLDI